MTKSATENRFEERIHRLSEEEAAIEHEVVFQLRSAELASARQALDQAARFFEFRVRWSEGRLAMLDFGDSTPRSPTSE